MSQTGQYINQSSRTPSHSFCAQICLARSLGHKSSCQPAVFVGFLTPWCVRMWFPTLCVPSGLPTLLKQTALTDQRGDPSLSRTILTGSHGGQEQNPMPLNYVSSSTEISSRPLCVCDSDPSCMWQTAESLLLIKASCGL